MWVWILLAVVVLLVVFGISQYNGLIALKNKVQEAWRQIDVELKRRHDLIPNLVETVKGYAAHESNTLEAVMKARSAAVSGASTPAAAAAKEGELSQALGRLIAVSEAYPDLKANSNFQALMGELSSTEDRIASARRYYNAIVRDFNTKIEAFPSNLFAGMAGASKAEYFETSQLEAQVPSVDFGQGSGAGSVGGGSTQPGAVSGPTTQPGAGGALPQAQAPYDPANPSQPNPNIDRQVPNE